jgi:hypothetical protein
MPDVWVQLYIGENKCGDVFDIDHVPKNISALKKAVYDAMDKDLGHCDAARLYVYEPGAEFPQDEALLSPWDDVPKDTTGPNPLRVVAPAIENRTGKNSMVISFPPECTCYNGMHWPVVPQNTNYSNSSL